SRSGGKCPAPVQGTNVMRHPRTLALAAIVIFAIGGRILPYFLKWLGVDPIGAHAAFPWNISPLAAICLFGGAYFPNRFWAIITPLLLMIVSDVLIGLMTGNPGYYTFHPGLPFVYLSYILIVGLGFLLKSHRRSVIAVGTSALTGSVLFF